MRKNEEVHAVSFVRDIGYILISGLLSLGICVVIVFLCSVGISNSLINPRMITQCTVISCVISSFIGTTFSIWHTSQKVLLSGLLTACAQFLFILLIGLFFFSEISFSGHGIKIIAGCIAGSLPAVFMVRKPKKKRRK